MFPDRFLTHSLRDMRIVRILAAALQAVEPGRLVSRYLENCKLPRHKRVYLLGMGKAAEPMTRAAAQVLGDVAGTLIITKHLSDQNQSAEASRLAPKIPYEAEPQFVMMEAGHPIPDLRSLTAGRHVESLISSLNTEDLLVCLISGGSSAMVTVLPPQVSLDDLQTLTARLLASGAGIEEVNVIRRQLDRLKGGGLVETTPARILGLILSDVIGDDLATIASGLTVPNPTNQWHVLEILSKYKIDPPESIRRVLNASQRIQDLSTFDRVQNVIIGNNHLAVAAARHQCEVEGFNIEIGSDFLTGEAKTVGENLAITLKAAGDSKPRPFSFVAGGETTVTIRGAGRGGRNQELALAAVNSLASTQDLMLLSLATDGNDGPTDAAGAVVTGQTRRRAADLGLLAEDLLARNDSYPFFDALDDLLKPGFTGTNVNDLTFLFGL